MHDEGFGHALGTAIKQRRRQKGWSQQKLAEAARVSTSTIRNAERGRTKTAYRLDVIARALGVKLQTLLDEADRMSASLFPDVGEFIAITMERRGMTATKLAAEMGVGVRDIERLVDGDAGPVMWGAAAVALDIHPRLIEAIAEGHVVEDTGRAGVQPDLAAWLEQRKTKDQYPEGS
jgi:transcriptional regulator with XRE-family HTH domain